jgi:RodZ C-terminal domain
MPETRIERLIFGVGALAIAALVALIVLEKADRFATRQTHAATPLATTPVTTATAETTSASETMAESTTATEPQSTATGITLRLRAIADTWVEIRAGSADGDVLYSGILGQGNTKRFRGKQVWASFGAASNLTARLNGDPLQLPPGTYGALISTSGLQPLD